MAFLAEKLMKRRVLEFGPALPDQSGLILPARITLPHFSVSSEMSLPKSAGEPGSGVAPRSASRAFILGSASAALIPLLRLAMISGGVFVGAPEAPHGARFVTRDELADGWYVRQCLGARC